MQLRMRSVNLAKIMYHLQWRSKSRIRIKPQNSFLIVWFIQVSNWMEWNWWSYSTSSHGNIATVFWSLFIQNHNRIDVLIIILHCCWREWSILEFNDVFFVAYISVLFVYLYLDINQECNIWCMPSFHEGVFPIINGAHYNLVVYMSSVIHVHV